MFRRLTNLIVVCCMFFSSCTKDDQNDYRALDYDSSSIPTVSTKTVSSVTQVSALCGGKILSDGGSPVISYGVCWSTLQYPTIIDNKTNDGSGNGNFTSNLVHLAVGTTYYVRAFAKNINGVGYGEQQTFTTSSLLQIGIEHEGGIIFYIDSTGEHGLVCAKQDMPSLAIWGCPNTQLIGADGAALGSGRENTSDIINNCHSSGIAAEVCSLYSYDVFNDWFLPSKDELKLMYNNLHLAHLGGFSGAAYWSSTEMTNIFAWQIAFNSGIVQGATKTTPSAVRAVREF